MESLDRGALSLVAFYAWWGSYLRESRWAIAARRPGVDLVIDAEDPASIRAALRERDVVIDAAGPFQRRSTVLVESCMTLGCDVIDVSDSLDYARRLRALERRIESAGIRVLTSCSSVSAVSAALVRLSGGFGIDVEEASGTRDRRLRPRDA